MNLQRGQGRTLVQCCDPHGHHSDRWRPWFALEEGFADLEGEPFVAYHCATCVDAIDKRDWPTAERQRISLELVRIGALQRERAGQLVPRALRGRQ